MKDIGKDGERIDMAAERLCANFDSVGRVMRKSWDRKFAGFCVHS
jgi:hypothetical protein